MELGSHLGLLRLNTYHGWSHCKLESVCFGRERHLLCSFLLPSPLRISENLLLQLLNVYKGRGYWKSDWLVLLLGSNGENLACEGSCIH
jgi:hypothetical protein